MTSYPIKTPDGPIGELRTKRLLLLAQSPNQWHKRFYHQYYYLCWEGLTGWMLGTAYLTDKGKEELKRIMMSDGK